MKGRIRMGLIMLIKRKKKKNGEKKTKTVKIEIKKINAVRK